MLGRLATQISAVLMGKHKPTYDPSDPGCGDYVVVINASDIVYSKKTYEKKVYYWYTGWPGGLKKRSLKVGNAYGWVVLMSRKWKRRIRSGFCGRLCMVCFRRIELDRGDVCDV